MGGEAFTFHDSDTNDEGDANYRTDNEGLDLVKGNGGTAIGYTAKGEWTEYSVNVKEPGEYSFEATCSNGASSNGGFTINLVKGTTVTKIGTVTVSSTTSPSPVVPRLSTTIWVQVLPMITPSSRAMLSVTSVTTSTETSP